MSLRRYDLQQYIELLDEHQLIQYIQADQNALEREVEHLSYDSRDMKPGGLFICKGAHFLPRYLQEAVDRGAFCYISEKEYDLPGKDVAMILVTDIRKTMALLANRFFNEAWKQLNLIGITGTKGKSTTTYYVKYILDHYLSASGKSPCAILSGIDVDDGVISEESHLTTPEAVMLHRHFRNAVDSAGIPTMEVSAKP